MSERSVKNPTDVITIDFADYVDNHRHAQAVHLVNGIPDYSFSLDYKLRRQLSSLQPVRFLLKAVVRGIEPIQQQLSMMNMVAVGPRQYPEIHAIGEHCAKTLGIGIPRIFVQPSGAPNAYTFASDDVKPSIVVTTQLTDMLDHQELTAVIGHECGHIQNLHSAYNTLVEMLTNPVANGLLQQMTQAGVSIPLLPLFASLLSQAVMLFFLRWNRCAEITCDRAGAICANGVDSMITALVKMQIGGKAALADININEYVRQLIQVKATPVRLVELLQTHPLASKRVEAMRLFAKCDVLHSWCPTLWTGAEQLSITQVNTACEGLIQVWSSKYTLTEEQTYHVNRTSQTSRRRDECRHQPSRHL